MRLANGKKKGNMQYVSPNMYSAHNMYPQNGVLEAIIGWKWMKFDGFGKIWEPCKFKFHYIELHLQYSELSLQYNHRCSS